MSYLEIARRLDSQDKPTEAAWAYEIALQSAPDRSVFVDLAVLYFVVCDPGYAAEHRVDKQFLDAAYDRALEVLDLAERTLGPNGECEFWRLFIAERVIGRAVARETYIRLASRGETALPLLALFAASGGTEFRQEVKQLLQYCRLGRTARERYICSLAQM